MLLDIKNITKNYGKNIALDDISLTLDRGLYGLLGENGAGKTTLFNSIIGYEEINKGSIKINTDKIGYLPQKFMGYPDFTTHEFLSYIYYLRDNGTHGNEEIKDIEKVFNLSHLDKVKLKKMSGGQLRRVGLAQAFLGDPAIILLDEPTTGLDANERIKFKNYVSEMSHKKLIILSTHIVDDLKYISDEIIILHNHKLALKGNEENLLNKLEGCVWELDYKEYKNRNISNSLVSKTYQKDGIDFVRIISKEKPSESSILIKPTLDDVFLSTIRDSNL